MNSEVIDRDGDLHFSRCRASKEKYKGDELIFQNEFHNCPLIIKFSTKQSSTMKRFVESIVQIAMARSSGHRRRVIYRSAEEFRMIKIPAMILGTYSSVSFLSIPERMITHGSRDPVLSIAF